MLKKVKFALPFVASTINMARRCKNIFEDVVDYGKIFADVKNYDLYGRGAFGVESCGEDVEEKACGEDVEEESEDGSYLLASCDEEDFEESEEEEDKDGYEEDEIVDIFGDAERGKEDPPATQTRRTRQRTKMSTRRMRMQKFGRSMISCWTT